jgi:hypothetical protein
LGDACDNCPHGANDDQRDWDGDGEGDVCDCNDGYKGPLETGADCGGYCHGIGGSCDECIPLIVNGNHGDKIDIVFVPDEDYGGDTAAFLDDVWNVIDNGLYAPSAFGVSDASDYRCKFNFYYYPHDGDYEPTCVKWDMPSNINSHCSFADVKVIVFSGEGRACAYGDVFSTSIQNPRIVVHELGHSAFDLEDEYCCDGNYGGPNTYSSEGNCWDNTLWPGDSCVEFCPDVKCWPIGVDQYQNCVDHFMGKGEPENAHKCSCTSYAAHTGRDPDECVPIDPADCPPVWSYWYWPDFGVTDPSAFGIQSPNWCNWRGEGVQECCGNGKWKADSEGCFMGSWYMTHFSRDCAPHVEDVLYDLPPCQVGQSVPNPALSDASARGGGRDDAGVLAETDMTKVVILTYNLQGDALTLLDAQFAYNHPPNHFRSEGAFVARGLSSLGNTLEEVFLRDPREFHMGEQKDFEQGMMMGDDVDFTVILPFPDMLTRVAVVDPETEEPLHEADLSERVIDFCRSVGYEDPQCRASDVDGDSVPDGDDNCPMIANPDQADGDGDGKGDVCDANLHCGDGIIQWKKGETCDPPGSVCGSYGNADFMCDEFCQCVYAGLCGDGKIQWGAGEQCEPSEGLDSCGPGKVCVNCTCVPTRPSCGDGIVEWRRGEECEPGVGNECGPYGQCISCVCVRD